MTGVVMCTVSLMLGGVVSVQGFLPGLADPANLILTASAFVVPLAAGVMAQCVAALVRGMGDLIGTTPRGVRSAVWVRFLSVAAWQSLAFALLAGAILIRSDLGGTVSGPMFLLALSATAALCLGLTTGAVFGLRWNTPTVGPLTALVIFFWIYGLAFLPDPWLRLSPLYAEVRYRVYFQPAGPLVGAQILAMLGVAALAAGFLTSKAFRTMWLVIALGALGATTLLLSNTTTLAPVEFRTAPQNPPCDVLDEIRLCVWPESRARLRPSLEALARVRRAAEPAYDIPTDWREPGLAQDPGGGQATYPVPPPGEDTYLFLAIQATLPTVTCRSANAEHALTALSTWLNGRLVPESVVDGPVREVLEQDQADQRAWVQARRLDVSRC